MEPSSYPATSLLPADEQTADSDIFTANLLGPHPEVYKANAEEAQSTPMHTADVLKGCHYLKYNLRAVIKSW